ncbi:MAG: CPBP family intramembrane metalloprotease [Actinomycetota bacterium]|nr:CPBP family intramembrane metalloprotease [Actinomycetota bacterium]
MGMREPPLGGREELTAFFLLAYALSWSVWLVAIALQVLVPDGPVVALALVGAFGPSVAALAVTRRAGRPLSVRRAWRSRPRGPIPVRVYATVLLGPVAAGLVVLPVVIAMDTSSVTGPVFPWPGLVPAFVLGAPLGQEPGWRGFALPRLQTLVSPAWAGVVLGVIWALWHVPLLLIGPSWQSRLPLGWFALWILTLSVLFAWAYNASGGRVLVAVLGHAAVNFTAAVLFPWLLAPQADTRPFAVFTVVLALAAGALLARDRRLGARAA